MDHCKPFHLAAHGAVFDAFHLTYMYICRKTLFSSTCHKMMSLTILVGVHSSNIFTEFHLNRCNRFWIKVCNRQVDRQTGKVGGSESIRFDAASTDLLKWIARELISWNKLSYIFERNWFDLNKKCYYCLYTNLPSPFFVLFITTDRIGFPDKNGNEHSDIIFLR